MPDEGRPGAVVVVELGSVAEAAAQITECERRWVDVPIIAVAPVTIGRDVTDLVSRGALGVVSACETEDWIAHAIEAARARKPFTSPAVAAIAVDEMFSRVNGRPRERVSVSLTARENELLGLICAGKTDRETAGELGISLHTVRTHRTKIKQKIGVRTVADLVRKTLELRLLP